LDKFPQRTSEIRENYQATFRREVNETMDQVVANHEFLAMNELNLQSRLGDTYKRIVAADPDGWLEGSTNYIRRLGEIRGDYQQVWSEYISLVDEAFDKVSSYFSDATKNLSALNDVAKGIKAKAIEPSFSLLDRTRLSLDEVRRQILMVEFS
jgi:hypothetical protein